jgi:hypothetical protein
MPRPKDEKHGSHAECRAQGLQEVMTSREESKDELNAFAFVVSSGIEKENVHYTSS